MDEVDNVVNYLDNLNDGLIPLNGINDSLTVK